MLRWPVALAVAACLAVAGLASPPAPAAAKKKCTNVVLANGKKACVRPGDRCRASDQQTYLAVGLSCKKKRLRRASPEERRGEDPILLNDEGQVEMRTAMEMFNQLVAPMPGVKPRAGAVGEPLDATSAMLVIGANLDDLTDAQRAVYEQMTTPQPIRSMKAPPTVQEQQETLQLVDDARRTYEAHGYAFPKPIHVNFLDDQGTGDAGTWAYVSGRDIIEGTPTCEMFITAKGRAEDPVFKRAMIAHEVAHCAQHAFYGSVQEALRVPQWVVEGGAQWLGWSAAQERGEVPEAGFAWNPWLRTPNFDLFGRSYPAVGFFALLRQGGVNVFERYKAILNGATASGSTGAYQAATGGGSPSGFQYWGPGFVRFRSFGGFWNLEGPGIVQSGSPVNFVLSRGDVEAISAFPRAGNAATIRLQSEIVVLTVAPGTKGIWRDTVGRIRRVASGAYTTIQGGFRCRTGRDIQLPYVDARASVDMGIGQGARRLGYVVFQGMSKEDYCNGRRPPRPPSVPSTCFQPVEEDNARQEPEGDCGATPPGIDIYGENEQLLASFKSGNCTAGDPTAGGDFVATSTDGAWSLEVGVDGFAGFDQYHPVTFGAPDPQVLIDGPGGPYGNQATAPGPAPSGTVYIHPNGELGLGGVFLNQPSESGVIAAGVMDCLYPDDV